MIQHTPLTKKSNILVCWTFYIPKIRTLLSLYIQTNRLVDMLVDKLLDMLVDMLVDKLLDMKYQFSTKCGKLHSKLWITEQPL